MDYNYENLGEQKFQQFCQALLVHEFRGLQCLPIGQPDGGRDAFVYILRGENKSLLIFQVKYVRNPKADKDSHKWLINIMKEEVEKIQLLLPRGVSQYLLLTNVTGTAHLDSGSIDQLDKILNESLGLPSQCWWRDDLSRRLDSRWDLKWSYPEVLSGIDVLGMLFREGLREATERRETAIKNYIKKQFQLEKDVKFRQIDFSNKLLDIFVDVPVFKKHSFRNNPSFSVRDLHSPFDIWDSEDGEGEDNDEYLDLMERGLLGAADLLLSSKVAAHSPRVLIEGAPGQGKSTITQYVCQVYRTKILGKGEDLQQIPTKHKESGIRIPLKLDLRDLALWIGRQNPFVTTKDQAVPSNWKPTLESFLANQISYLSGGVEFHVSDLYAVAKVSAILLVLDGLDEVPDRERREQLIDIVEEGLDYLIDDAASLQVVVTSRPAAFANSPGFSPSEFQYFELMSLQEEHIQVYAEKWINSRQISEHDANEIRSILQEKLNQPHLRDLARTPMQLAILLSLIHSRGSSLPDKRTALYDSYIEIFFNREVEKSPVVRQYRSELIDIHHYLGWLLHSEAEHADSRGSIAEDRLLQILREYLIQQGFEGTTIADDLFTGTVQRVGALISRVEGTFEFEVQPLREYFAARYLYNTAPYSPSGAEPMAGTKPDRFVAVSRNFYWLNVTRFFAGCFSTGELGSLVDMIDELLTQDGYSLISHPRDLAVTLLSDWVFAQQPRTMRRLVQTLIEDDRFRFVLPTRVAPFSRRSRGMPLIVPPQYSKELLVHCFKVLSTNPPSEYADQIIALARINGTENDLLGHWNYEVGKITTSSELKVWLGYASRLNILQSISIDRFEELLADAEVIVLLARFHYHSFFSRDVLIQSLFQSILHYATPDILQSALEASSPPSDNALLVFLVNIGIVYRSLIVMAEWHFDDIFFGEQFLSSTTQRRSTQLQVTLGNRTSIIQQIEAFNNCALELGLQSDFNNLPKFNLHGIITILTQIWGDTWLSRYLALLSTRHSRRTNTSLSADISPFDEKLDILHRVETAYHKRKEYRWWKKHLSLAGSEENSLFLYVLMFRFGELNLLIRFAEELDSFVICSSEAAWKRLWNSVPKPRIKDSRVDQRRRSKALTQIAQQISFRTVAIIGMTTSPTNTLFLYESFLSDYSGDDEFVLTFCAKAALLDLQNGSENPIRCLRIISSAYRNNAVVERQTEQSVKLDIRTAREILESPTIYPMFLIDAANTSFTEHVTSAITPVSIIAETDKWFVS